jgi:hypothetical protein
VIAPISNDGKLRHFSFEERAMESESNSGSSRHALSAHILSASVVMIGVSTTLIGLVKVAKAHMGATGADQYAALTALLFLCSALTSF